MRYAEPTILFARGEFFSSNRWRGIEREIARAVAGIVWPEGADTFTIRRAKDGNGVVPIRKAFLDNLVRNNSSWVREAPVLDAFGVGDYDAALPLEGGWFVIEWETGNVSSTHRSLNRIALAIRERGRIEAERMRRGGAVGDGEPERRVLGGMVVLPSGELAPWLTDRVGNYPEVEPYFPLYRNIEADAGYLAVMQVSQDQTDEAGITPLLPKGRDGNAARRPTTVG